MGSEKIKPVPVSCAPEDREMVVVNGNGGSSHNENSEEESSWTEEEDHSDKLVAAETLKIEDTEEMELRKRALALLGVGVEETEKKTNKEEEEASESKSERSSIADDDDDDDSESSSDESSSDDESLDPKQRQPPRGVLRASSFDDPDFLWSKRGQRETVDVSFSNQIGFKEIPKWEPEDKLNLFYDKDDIKRFRLDAATEKQAKENKKRSKLRTAIDSLPSFWG